MTDEYEPEGSPASPMAIEVISKSYNLDLSTHRSKILDARDVESAHAIFCVTEKHAEAVCEAFPSAGYAGKVHALGVDVPDPWKRGEDEYKSTAQMLKPLVDDVMTKLLLCSWTL